MRQDSRRTLLLWPITASLAVIAATTAPFLLEDDSWAVATRWLTQIGVLEPSQQVADQNASRPDGLASDRQHGFGAAEPFTLLNQSDVESPRPPAENAHRDDRGARGLAMPSRLVATTEDVPAELKAPVVDSEAELAGFADALAEIEVHEIAEELKQAVPASLTPGLDDPIAATEMPLTLPEEIFHADEEDEEVAGSTKLIPESVKVLAKPSATKPDVPQLDLNLPHLVRPPVASPADVVQASPARHVTGWPLAKQLQTQLSSIASRASLTRKTDSGMQQTMLTSVDIASSDLQSVENEMLRRGESALSAAHRETLQRQATSIVMGRWAEQVEQRLEQLREHTRLGDESAGEVLHELSSLAAAGLQLAERVPARDQQVQWLQASHSLARRTSVWASIWHLARGHASDFVPSGTLPSETLTLHRQSASAEQLDVHQLLRNVRSGLPETGDAEGWTTFLLLNKIQSLASSDDMDERALTAQRYLSRITSNRLAPEHEEWLDQPSVKQLTEAMKAWSAMPIDYVALLQDLERAEADSIDLAAVKVTNAFQSLRFSDDTYAARVAKVIDLNYRNANVRTAISAKLIERLIPSVPDQTTPIVTQIAGTPVRGTSNVSTALNLRLNPTPGEWNLNLLTRGDVSTQSRAHESGVTVHTDGWADFQASTPVRILPTGLEVGGTRVDVNATNRLRRVDSKVNGWPLIGSLVRGIAEKKYEDTKALANRKTRDQIRSEVSGKTQSELETQTEKAEQKWDDLVLGPLGRLELDPTVIDLETTQERLIARYRLAGDWQLAAHTPRPRAWNDSWLSVQMHQSAINNTLEQLLPRGEVKTFEQLYTDTFALFGKEGMTLPEEVPGDAEIAFSSTRPVTIEIEDGLMWLTLRVVRLSQPGSPKLTRFIVRAAYKPEFDGLDARLVRDGHLRISGPGMSMRQRLPIRAIFNKVLAEDRVIPLTTPKLVEHPAVQDLKVSQLELRDGWLALALSPESDRLR